MVLAASLVLLGLSVLLALGNVTGCLQAMWRRRQGSPRGFSCVPLISAFLAVGAWLLGHDRLGYWALLPALLDPGTWMVPVALIAAILRRGTGRPDPD